MRIVGIDPAPSKGLHVFDGQHAQVPVEHCRAFLAELESSPDVLLCWDAPLTGPSSGTVAGNEAVGRDFTQRLVESFFRKASTGFKAPKGVSVLGYAGCPHWTLGRSLMGLPRTGPFDHSEDALPFGLAVGPGPPRAGRHIVEVHPAVATWLWIVRSNAGIEQWNYKDDDEVLSRFWVELQRGPWANIPGLPELPPPADDDELDSRVAYALGWLWCNAENTDVRLLGDRDCGAFLLPVDQALERAFADFIASIGVV